ncbi:MAG: outer membrane lipoprotein-sorting protein [Desulfuromonadales bacterium]|nr:outer membrane lipoprotein-sorting protein [Desulfuromonadales bacterium]
MRLILTTALTTALIMLSLLAVAAAELSADQIVERANQAAYYAGQDGRAEVHMTIRDAQGGTRQRAFTILRLNTGDGDQKFYVYFTEPADVRKMAYLVWKNVGGEDDRWLWLPALNLNKRIAPGDKRTSFVGSDFFYEDVSGRGLEEDGHELVETTDRHFLLKHTPKNPSAVEFAWFQTWIDRQTFLPMRAEYYDAGGNRYREVEALKVETVQGYPTVTVSEARDLRAGSSTRNAFSNVSYEIGLQEQIFTERFLRRPPREVSR